MSTNEYQWVQLIKLNFSSQRSNSRWRFACGDVHSSVPKLIVTFKWNCKFHRLQIIIVLLYFKIFFRKHELQMFAQLLRDTNIEHDNFLNQIHKRYQIKIRIISEYKTQVISGIIGFSGKMLKIVWEKCNLESSRYNSGQGN